MSSCRSGPVSTATSLIHTGPSLLWIIMDSYSTNQNSRCNHFDNKYIWLYINGNNDEWQKFCYEVLEAKRRGPPTTMNVHAIPSVKELAARQAYTTVQYTNGLYFPWGDDCVSPLVSRTNNQPTRRKRLLLLRTSGRTV